MLKAHFDHNREEVYSLVRKAIPNLNVRDAKAVADVAYAYGSSHKNNGTYPQFKSIVSAALPPNIREKQLRPVFKELFDYTPNGDKKSKPKYSYGPKARARDTAHNSLPSLRVQAGTNSSGLISRIRE